MAVGLGRARPTPWCLYPAGGLAAEPPRGHADPDAYVYDPEDPRSTRGGGLLLSRPYLPGPADQRVLLDRREVLVYTVEPLERELELTGPVSAVL